MEVKQIVAELDQEIVRLREARALLSGEDSRARPRGRAAVKSISAGKPKRKHNLSAAGRKRISDALKRRWAARRKAASGKGAKKAA